jgi:putative ABC transport system substrate-binding protein
MKRRAFITLLGGATVALPLAARAQQGNRIGHVATLWPFTEDNVEGQTLFAALRQGLQEFGWTDVQLESRWSGGNIERAQAYAAEIVASAPDVIFAYFNAQLAPLAHATRTIPIVFVGASDPVGAGYVASLRYPGGNITGFTLYEPSLAGKWLGVLKEAAPATARAALLINPDTAILHGTFYSQAFEAAATSLGIEPVIAKVYSPADIETTIGALGKQPGSGLIVAPDTFSESNGDLIVSLTAEHRVPAVYAIGRFAKRGGLMSYGPDTLAAVRRAIAYIDRILRGEKPADLPVQAPIKFELVVNLRAAKAMALTVAESFLLRADEVIE